MTDPRWERAVELFHSALERGPDERDAYLRAACGTDESLYETVLALVAADRRADDDPFEQIAEAAAADVITDSSPGTLVGQQIARYRVVSHLGSGGMGDVFRASDPALGRDVALKLLAPRFQADANFHYRLEKEARAASSLNHPNIVTIYEVGRSDGYEFVASELVDGETLRSVIRRGPLPVRSLSEIGGQVAAGLAAAHEAGIIHRDIKPENIMIRRDGLVKVVDFGLAKSAAVREGDASAPTRLTAVSRTIAGTRAYMSPEQALGRTVDHRSDLFAVGIVLYEMATGSRPFTGPSEAAMYDALLHASASRTVGASARSAAGGRRRDRPRAREGPRAAVSVGGGSWSRVETAAAAAVGRASRRCRPRRQLAPRSGGGGSRPSPQGLLAIALALAVVRWPASAAVVPTRFTIAPPPHTEFTLTGTVVPSVTVTVSPDGRRVVFLANEPNAPGRLWVRSSTPSTRFRSTTPRTRRFRSGLRMQTAWRFLSTVLCASSRWPGGRRGQSPRQRGGVEAPGTALASLCLAPQKGQSIRCRLRAARHRRSQPSTAHAENRGTGFPSSCPTAGISCTRPRGRESGAVRRFPRWGARASVCFPRR